MRPPPPSCSRFRAGRWRIRRTDPRLISALAIAVALAASVQSTVAQTAQQQSVLQQIRQLDRDQLSVSEEDGRFLRVTVVSSGARRALEIGGAYGYSAIWIGL